MKGELKPSELRIGNWAMYDPNVFIDDPYATPKPHYPVKIEDGEAIDLAIEGCYTPIPITEEILKAVGAIKWGDKQWKIGWLDLGKVGDSYHVAINNFEHTMFEGAKYLHQLQNMYYCLKGKELEVNLNKEEDK